VEGAILAKGEPRVVRLDGHWIDLMPAGDLLIMRNQDKPGVMGRVGTLLGARGINIGELRLGRRDAHPGAVSVWQVDEPVANSILEELSAFEEIESVRQVHLGASPRPGDHQVRK
jgi:D-3-phosphoglycerate dehydrogenase